MWDKEVEVEEVYVRYRSFDFFFWFSIWDVGLVLGGDREVES